MKWFDAGTKKMSVSTFGSFIKLMKLRCTAAWVSPRDRCSAAQAQLVTHNEGPAGRGPPRPRCCPRPGRHCGPGSTRDPQRRPRRSCPGNLPGRIMIMISGPGGQSDSDVGRPGPTRFEVSFQSLFWKCKSISLKKLKLSLSPSPQWPQAALRVGGDGRQVP